MAWSSQELIVWKDSVVHLDLLYITSGPRCTTDTLANHCELMMMNRSVKLCNPSTLTLHVPSSFRAFLADFDFVDG